MENNQKGFIEIGVTFFLFVVAVLYATKTVLEAPPAPPTTQTICAEGHMEKTGDGCKDLSSVPVKK